MPDLKEVLMHLGNKLVTEHHYDPAMRGVASSGVNDHAMMGRTTLVIDYFTRWINGHPEAQAVLRELGYEWSMPKRRISTEAAE